MSERYYLVTWKEMGTNEERSAEASTLEAARKEPYSHAYGPYSSTIRVYQRERKEQK